MEGNCPAHYALRQMTSIENNLNFLMLAKKCLESFHVPESNERNGSSGGINCGNLTFSPVQYNPVDSPLYFDDLQY